MRKRIKPPLRRAKCAKYRYHLKKETAFSVRYAKSGFLLGIARILDFGNTLHLKSTFSNPAEADARALRSDWKMIGQDIRHAIVRFKEREPLTLRKKS